MFHIIKPADGETTAQELRHGKMHGTTAERKLMSGTGALIRWNAKHVKVTGEKPNSNKGDKRP